MRQQGEEGVADGLGEGDQFFSEVEADLSDVANPLAGATVARTPTTAEPVDVESVWYSDPENPDLVRYWEGAEAAWYPDPTNPGMVRYWNGSRWMDLVTPQLPSLASLGDSAPTTPPPLRSMPIATKRSWRSRTKSTLGRLADYPRSRVSVMPRFLRGREEKPPTADQRDRPHV